VVGVTVVCLVVLVGYFQVPFTGKTFSTSTYVLGYKGCGSPQGVCRYNKRNDPRPDGGASAWQLEPWAQVTHRIVTSGHVPLWNPDEGLGTPLAADPPTAALDPLMLGIFLHPSELVTDLSTLLWLLLIGVAAYAAARALRTGPVAATVAGIVYGLSGWFFAYSNNWFFRVYLFLPLIIAAVEWTIRSRRRLPPALLAVALAWMVLVGMPEPMFMSVVGAAAFTVIRLLVGDRAGSRRLAALRLLGAGALGVLLAAPAILGYREYLSLSFNLHPFTGLPLQTDSAHQLVDWLMPKITTAPIKAPFDDREWIGAGAVLLGVIAMLHPRAMRRHAGWPLVAMAAVVGLPIYGGHLASWTGHIPVWSQVGWTRFATPVLALSGALLAAIGLQVVLDGAVTRRRAIGAVGLLAAAVAVFLRTDRRELDLWHHVSFRGGWPPALLTILAVFGAVLFLRGRIAALAIACVVVVELVLLVPFGIYASRANPYPVEPWVKFLQTNTRDASRVFSTQGFLYPDVSGAYGLSDLRALDALFPQRYWDFVKTFVSHGIVDRFTAVDPNESVPDVAANPMFDLLGVRFLVYHDAPNFAPPPTSPAQYRIVYEADGIKIYENLHAAPRVFVAHDVHAEADENAALQYLVGKGGAPFPDGSVDVRGFDPRSSAVIEAKAPIAPAPNCPARTASYSHIVSYSSSYVKIAVTNNCPGLLVLSDEYFPGWSASVNGHHAHVYPTDVALRGVQVPAGRSTVEFRYRPASFRNGVILFAVGLLVLAFLAATGLRSSDLWGRRRVARGARTDLPGSAPGPPSPDPVGPVTVPDG